MFPYKGREQKGTEGNRTEEKGREQMAGKVKAKVSLAGRRAMSRGARKAAGDTRVNRFAPKRGAKQGYNARLDESLGARKRRRS